MNTKLFVVHVTQTGGSLGGGVSKYISDLQQWQLNNGIHAITICCDRIPPADISSHVVWLNRRWPKLIGATRVAMWLNESKRKPDIIHIHGLRCFHNVQAAKWAHLNKIPVVITPHGQLMPWTMMRSRWKKILYDSLFEKPNLKIAATIHFVSEMEKNKSWFNEIHRNKASVIPIGLNFEQWNNLKDAPINTIDINKPIITYFGRLSVHKGLDIIIEALPEIRRKFPEIQLAVAGVDPDGIKPALQKRAEQLGVSSSITWINPIHRTEAKWLISKSDAFLLPSRGEGFPIGVLEALSLGTQIVASYEAAWDNLSQLGYGENCHLNGTSTAEATMKILRIPRDTIEMRRAEISAEIKEKYTWDYCGNNILKLYYDSLKGGCTGK